uniref:FH2 domain-containing protein n=1 Tax=Lates calcarifer TaxID=8187 RepID=A0A4W6EF18_LATCA
MTRFGSQTIWAGLEPVHLDTNRLEYLFESKEEELCLIKDAKAQNPHSHLAQAELCLLTLGEISHLSSRLQLWAFALDYDSLERVSEKPLFHLKLAMEQLAASQTFKCILATVLAIGNFLNGCKARGFELSYLGKLSQVRDTHSRQPLLHHVCVLLLQLYPQSSDLYSDITMCVCVCVVCVCVCVCVSVTLAFDSTSFLLSLKCDYSLVQSNLSQLEALCKASWEQLKVLDKAEEKRKGGKGDKRRGGGGDEGSLRHRLPKILKECEERLKVLRAVHRRVINRCSSYLI